jgi:hypothetical protein
LIDIAGSHKHWFENKHFDDYAAHRPHIDLVSILSSSKD